MHDAFSDELRVAAATYDHAKGISDVYRSVQIDPQVLLDLVSSSTEVAAAARELLGAQGGFLCPPAEIDMDMALRNGVTLVSLRKGEVVGFNRFATDARTVLESFCTEFRLDPSTDHSDGDRLADWTGQIEVNDYRMLTGVGWADRERAVAAFQGAKAGAEGAEHGKLAWAIDAAVAPRYQRSGIGKILSVGIRETLKAMGYAWAAYRMFEIQGINGTDLGIHNDLSRKVFTDPSSRLFAYTEEQIRIRDDIQMTVRWNHWLKRY